MGEISKVIERIRSRPARVTPGTTVVEGGQVVAPVG
jgi:hypothetical protein